MRKYLMLLASTGLLGLGACGPGAANVKACEAAQGAVRDKVCFQDDVELDWKCETYDNPYPCNVSDYFKCLLDAYTCDPDTAEGNLNFDENLCKNILEGGC